MHTCTGNLNISPGFESFEILRIPNFPPTDILGVGALALKNFDFRFMDLRSVVSSFEELDVVTYLYENEIKSNTVFCFLIEVGICYYVHGYVDRNKKYGVIYIDVYAASGQKRFYIREGKILEG